MGNQCPCLQTNNKNSSHYALLEEKNGTLISETSESKDVKNEMNSNHQNPYSFGAPNLAVPNTMGGNSPILNVNRSFDEDNIAEQMKQTQNGNIEIYIKNEGEIEDRDTFKKKVKLDDFTILKVILIVSL